LTITYTISLTGLPAIAIPCGWTSAGLPVEVQIIGKPRGKKRLVQIAAALEAAFRASKSN